MNWLVFALSLYAAGFFAALAASWTLSQWDGLALELLSAALLAVWPFSLPIMAVVHFTAFHLRYVQDPMSGRIVPRRSVKRVKAQRARRA